MAFDATDWTITRASGNIRYTGDAHGTGTPTYATGIELHRALQDFADQEVDSGDDELSIIDNVPSQRGGVDTNITLLNGFNIDQLASEHLYDTSVTQAGGAEIYDGIQVFGNAVSIQVIQDGARLTNDWWNEANMIAAVEDAASSTSHRFLLLVRTGGSDIDGRRLIGTQRVLGTVYTEFSIGGGTNRGNNVLALTANSDLNNQTSAVNIALMDTIVNATEGYNLLNVDTLGNDPYYSNWTIGTQTKNDFYERAKWIQTEEAGARDADQIIYGLDGDIFRGITHEIVIDTPTGTFSAFEGVSWPTGTGQMLAIDSPTAGTKMWIQLLTGIAPVDNQLITGVSTATALMAVTITPKLLNLPFVGVSTGSAILGAYGVGILPADLGQNDSATDLNDGVNVPLNNVTFTVNGLVSSEDYVLVGPEAGGLLDVAQLGQNAAVAGAAVGTLVMDSAIPVDTPQGGQIRCLVSDGRYVKVPFDSYTGSTFTLTGTFDFSGAGNDVEINANVFVAYIDELNSVGTSLSFTTVYNNGLGDRTLVVRRRYGAAGGGGPTVPAESTAVLGSGGGQTTPARVSDL
jgi:hypothetical protein